MTVTSRLGARTARVAAIYDIHGNLPALEAVLLDIRREGVDLVVVGGDVLPGPMPRETLASVLDLGMSVRFIQGNGDREVAARMAGTETAWYRNAPDQWREPVRWTAQELEPARQPVIARWPPTLEIEVEGLGRVLFCHATPHSDTEIITRVTPDDRVLPALEGVGAPLVVCGHTHMQFDRMIGGVRVINAGSVGMPFGVPGAWWLLLGPLVEMRHTMYDLEEAARRIRETSYPQAGEFAAHSVLRPPSERAMLEVFGRTEPR